MSAASRRCGNSISTSRPHHPPIAAQVDDRFASPHRRAGKRARRCSGLRVGAARSVRPACVPAREASAGNPRRSSGLFLQVFLKIGSSKSLKTSATHRYGLQNQQTKIFPFFTEFARYVAPRNMLQCVLRHAHGLVRAKLIGPVPHVQQVGSHE